MTFYPFGIFFANPTTLYVTDEGDSLSADADTDPIAGLERSSFKSATGQSELQDNCPKGVNPFCPPFPDPRAD